MTSDAISRFLSQRSRRLGRRTRLRPLANSEISDSAFRTYQSLGWTLLRLTASPILLCLASISFLTQFLPMLFLTAHKDDILAQVREAAWGCGVAICVAVPLFVLGFTYASAVVIQITSDQVLGNEPNPEAAVRKVKARLSRYVALVSFETLVAMSGLLASCALLVYSGVVAARTGDSDAGSGIVAGLAIILAIAGGLIYVAVRVSHALVLPIAVLEETRISTAGGRSRTLLRNRSVRTGSQGSVENVYALIALIWFVVASGAYALAGLLDLNGRVSSATAGFALQPILVQAVELLPIFVTLWFTIPLWGTAMTITYYDRRVRNEAYDIETLAADVWRSDRQSRFQL